MMKAKVLDRPMFKKKGPPVSPDEADNVGIMQGFMDQFDGMDDMEDEGDDDEMEMGKMMDRRPDSPEILMNNLRGDMRSVDARVEELADLVGYRAASDTPTEVLALLQPVLAQQSQMAQPPAQMMGAGPAGPMAAPAGGVADLAAMAQGPQTTAPMPEAPPPGGIGSLPAAAEQQAPMAMARGGYVQNFQQGSGEEGVTPVDTESQGAFYPPDMVTRAQQQISNLMSEQPMQQPSLDAAMKARLPMYERLAGLDKESVQAQMLFDIASGALNVAAGVDAEGRPIRGGISPVGRFAAGLKNVPAMIGARAGELAKGQREAKIAALQAGEKDIALIREYNYKLVDSQRKLAGDIVKTAAKGQGFGTGLKGQAYGFVTRFAPEYSSGTLPPEMERKFESAYTIITEPTYFTDPLTGNVTSRTPPVPAFLSTAIAARKSIPFAAPTKKGQKGGPTPAPENAPTVSAVPTPTTTETQPAPAVTEPAPAAAKGAQRQPSLWQLTPVLTGPIPAAKDVISSIPGFGDVGKDVTQARARYLGDFRELVKSLQNSPVYAQGERSAIETELNIEPRFFDDPAKLRNKLIGIDNFLVGRVEDARRNATNSNIPVDQRKEYVRIATSIENFRPKLGVPVRVFTIKEVEKLPSGTPFLWNGTDLQVRK
jgi:hypothetical protein